MERPESKTLQPLCAPRYHPFKHPLTSGDEVLRLDIPMEDKRVVAHIWANIEANSQRWVEESS